ncbi:MAG TPA: hypothetical protein VGC91_02375 [Pyrinomonadaceae bacterium]|jgi:hypothetical protein
MRSMLRLTLMLMAFGGVGVCAVVRGQALANDEILDPSKHVLRSAIQVNLTHHSATLPLHRGSYRGRTVWYVLTDVSDQTLANQLGLNFAPKLSNASHNCPGCVQNLQIPRNILEAGVVRFNGIPDFTPRRILVPGPTGFPAITVQPGARAGLLYTPYVQVAGTNIVYNAPIIAVGDSQGLFRFDVDGRNPFIHTFTHDRVLNIDLARQTVELLVIRAFSGGKEVVYLSFDSTSEEAAVLERSTFTPVLADLPFPNGEFRPDSARAALFSFANGKTGPTSPPAQGLNHLVIDGHAVEDASLDNRPLLAALRSGGDARNVLDVFPTMVPPFREEYSPAWDLHLSVWSRTAVATGANTARTDSNVIRTLAEQWVVTSPGGLPLRSAGIEVNCPVVAFVNDPPLMPVVPSPIQLPLPFSPDAP